MGLFREEATKALAQKVAETLVNLAGGGVLALFGAGALDPPDWLYPYQPYWAETYGYFMWLFGAMFVLGTMLCLRRRVGFAAVLFLIWATVFVVFRGNFLCDTQPCALTGWIAYGAAAALAPPVLGWLAARVVAQL